MSLGVSLGFRKQQGSLGLPGDGSVVSSFWALVLYLDDSGRKAEC